MAKGSKRFTHSKTRQNTALGLLAVIAILLGVVAFQPEPAPVSDSSPSTSDRTPSPAPVERSSASESNFANWDAAVAGLPDKSKPWTLAVLGDSTGNDRDEWVFLTAKWISAEHGRPVDIHQWDSTANEYTDTRRVGSGSGEPVTIWNHSAPGRTAAYTLDHLKASTPERPNAVIVNHGHNGAGAAQAQVSRLVDATLSRWDAPPALAVTLQNPHSDEATRRARASLSASLESSYKGSAVQVLDVRAAFESTNDVESLLMDDGLHPNSDGSKIWSEAVIEAFS